MKLDCLCMTYNVCMPVLKVYVFSYSRKQSAKCILSFCRCVWILEISSVKPKWFMLRVWFIYIRSITDSHISFSWELPLATNPSCNGVNTLMLWLNFGTYSWWLQNQSFITEQLRREFLKYRVQFFTILDRRIILGSKKKNVCVFIELRATSVRYIWPAFMQPCLRHFTLELSRKHSHK